MILTNDYDMNFWSNAKIFFLTINKKDSKGKKITLFTGIILKHNCNCHIIRLPIEISVPDE